MKRSIGICLLALFMLVGLAACSGAEQGRAGKSGAYSTGTTVGQIMEEAASGGDKEPAGEPDGDTAGGTPSGTVPAEEEKPEETPGETAPERSDAPEEPAAPAVEVDIDLTVLGANMVYAEVYGMVMRPEEYLGKTVRMRGTSYSGYYDVTDTTYYAIIIEDATACCAQGSEYVLAEGEIHPEDETEATVRGVFELYEELGEEYCRLADAVVEG